MVAFDMEQTELSSFEASSTMSLLGAAFFLRMAVAKSSSVLAPPAGLASLQNGT